MMDIIKGICGIPTAPGMENGMLGYIKETFVKDLEYRSDGMGNLTVIKRCGRQDAKSILLCTKTDIDGFIVNYIEDNGYLRVTRLGEPSSVSCAYTEVVSDKGVCGFIVPEKGADVKEGDVSKMYIDIGAHSRDEAQEVITLGDIFARVPSVRKLGASRVGGNGAASVLPAAILSKLMSELSPNNYDLYFCFTVQGSLMSRGAKTAAFDISPDICLCIDVCESFDTVGANRRGEAVLGNGAVILAKTADHCAGTILRDELESVAKSKDIAYRTCVYAEKKTAAAFISSCREGIPGAVVAVPARNIGSGAEIFDISDAESVYKLILEFVNNRIQ